MIAPARPDVAPQSGTPDCRHLDKSHHLHPFTDLQQYADNGGRVMTQADHVFVRDTDGREILDGMSGLWCCNLGYSQPAIVSAVSEQVTKLPYYNRVLTS